MVAPYFVVFKYHWIGFNASSPGVIFFFAAVLSINIVVGFLNQRFGLSKADLILIYCMLLMAVTVPTWGLMFFLIGTIVYPYYYGHARKPLRETLSRHHPGLDRTPRS